MRANMAVTSLLFLSLSSLLIHLKCQSSVTVRRKDLLDRVDVRGSPQVQSQVVLHRRLHNGTRRPLHRVVQSRVHNILLRRSRNALLERLGRRHRDPSTDTAKAPLQRLLHRLYNIFKFALNKQKTHGRCTLGPCHTFKHATWTWRGIPMLHLPSRW